MIIKEILTQLKYSCQPEFMAIPKVEYFSIFTTPCRKEMELKEYKASTKIKFTLLHECVNNIEGKILQKLDASEVVYIPENQLHFISSTQDTLCFLTKVKS